MTYKELIEKLHYDALYGKFYNKKGIKVGSIDRGYEIVLVNGIKYRAHRLAILWNTKELPKENELVHHKDKNKSNNILYNLEIKNTRLHMSEHCLYNINSKGMIYIEDHQGKWRVRIRYQRKRIIIGSYIWLKDAKIARDNAIIKYNLK